MSREDDNGLPPAGQHTSAFLRRRWQDTGEWPEPADRLLADLSDTAEPPDAEDDEMLSLLINDALEGIDITARYPALYRRVLAVTQLRKAFFDALELLEKSRTGELEPMPEGPSEDLTFLQKFAPMEPVLDQVGSQRWRLSWHRSQQQMQELFELFEPFLRFAPYYFDEELGVITLLHGEWPLEEGTIALQLEAWQPADAEELLSLSLVAAALPPGGRGAVPLSALQATIEWGDFQGTARFDPHGRADLPQLPLALILDENGRVKADLRLVVEQLA